MVAAMLAPRPGRHLAAGRPLSRHPPASHFARPRGIGQIEDHDDIADIAIELRRNIGVASVEGEAVHARTAAGPAGDLARRMRIAHVVNAEAALDAVARGDVRRNDLVIDQHEPIGHLHFVGMHAPRHGEMRDHLRPAGIT